MIKFLNLNKIKGTIKNLCETVWFLFFIFFQTTHTTGEINYLEPQICTTGKCSLSTKIATK